MVDKYLISKQTNKFLIKRSLLGKKDTKPFKDNLYTFMALYNYSKDCSCTCKYISVIRHFSEYRNRNMESALSLSSVAKVGESDYPDGTYTAPGHSARLGHASRRGHQNTRLLCLYTTLRVLLIIPKLKPQEKFLI